MKIETKLNVKPVTANTFNARTSAIVKSSNTLRDNVQALIEFGLKYYIENEGNTLYLTKTLETVSSLKTIPAFTVQQYIMLHANVTYTKNKDGKKVFKKIKKKDGKVMPSVQDVLETWYNHEVNAKNNTNTNWTAEGYAKTVLKVLKKHNVSKEDFLNDLQKAS